MSDTSWFPRGGTYCIGCRPPTDSETRWDAPPDPYFKRCPACPVTERQTIRWVLPDGLTPEDFDDESE